MFDTNSLKSLSLEGKVAIVTGSTQGLGEAVAHLFADRGIAGLLATWWFHRWSRDPSRPKLAKFMDDSVTGSSLRKAQSLIDEIAAFEHD